MRELKDIIKESIQSINQTTELFYQQKTKEGYEQLENTLILLSNTMNSVFSYIKEGNDIGINENELVQLLSDAMNAMEKKDIILLSDILQYELKELFENILQVI
ncbi:hypothetical protein EDD66_101161 [Mobilisporobacter senegalensis]|uniref:Uncharacterized protein n=1 Tax=Mobilisporobacter senegalensis TaxID=1329262 RepID=A0A3N1XY65_9FIRM|nr:hypothetical protein [Mobilisporobacter senegalensis]ROR31544.1 hypothetical protein EDD66_101161 [Mobilisporobacter senegalensis]